MLKITVHNWPGEFRLSLEGKLAGPWVGELRECWGLFSSCPANRPAIIDLSEVDFIDAAGRALLAEAHRQGAVLVAATPFIQALVEEIARSRCCATLEEKPATHDAVAANHAPGNN